MRVSSVDPLPASFRPSVTGGEAQRAPDGGYPVSKNPNPERLLDVVHRAALFALERTQAKHPEDVILTILTSVEGVADFISSLPVAGLEIVESRE